MKQRTNKTGIKRFLLCHHVRISTWVLLYMPVLYLWTERCGDNMTYQNMIPIVASAAPFLIGMCSSKTHRSRYRYLLWILSNMLCCIIMSLLDYYYFGKDYLNEIMTVALFYPLVCSPVIIARTYYSKELDLLDYFYRKEEPHIIGYVVGIIAGFYIILFSILFLLDHFDTKRIVISSIREDYFFIIITMIELVLYLIGYFIYIAYKEKKGEYIYFE